MKQRLTVDLAAHSLRVELQAVMVVQPADKSTYLFMEGKETANTVLLVFGSSRAEYCTTRIGDEGTEAGGH